MSEPTASAPVPPTIGPAQRNGASRSSCLGAGLRGLLTILLSVALSVATAGALAYFYLGYTPEAPGQLRVQQTALVAAQLDVQAQGQRSAVLQTTVADLTARDGASRETVQELAAQVADLEALGRQMQENNALAATVQAEARDARTAVALFSTAQAARASQIDELQRRSERISRFLERLGDISSDAAADLDPQGTVQPLPTLAALTVTPPSPEPSSTLALPTSTLTATLIITPTLGITPTAATRTTTPTP